MEKEKLRLDKYLWAIRLFKTRTAAATACDKGRVKIDGESVKASRVVKIDDTYEVKTDEKRWVIKVTGLLPKRVQYSEAIKFYEDQTPIEEKERIAFQTASFYSGKRLSKIGRPTKKERRDIDDFMEGTE
ncbi:MAG: RNA-binding S4 domain-containing protein [Chitinophagaceae bacterium]|jgi:ribosome-associated heat shock protein Hsp15